MIPESRVPGEWLIFLLAAITALPYIHDALFESNGGIDEISLSNPAYMFLHTGKVSYPAYGSPHAMVVHPPVKTFLVGVLLKLGLSLHVAEAVTGLGLVLPAIVCAALLPAPFFVRAALLFGVLVTSDIISHEFIMRPDVEVFGAWVLGILLLEWARRSGWNRLRAAAGSFFVAFAAGTHYFALPAALTILIYGVALLGDSRVRDRLNRAAWLAAGACLFGIPYLAWFVIPDWAGIRRVLASSGEHGSIQAALRETQSMGAWLYTTTQGWVKWISRIISIVPLLVVAALPLLASPHLRFFTLAALPLPFFISFLFGYKHYTYFTAEFFLFGAGLFLAPCLLLARWIRGWRLSLAVSVLFTALGANNLAMQFNGERFLDWHLPEFEEIDIARAAGRKILGPDARVGYRLSLWRIGGEAHWYLIDQDIHWPKRLVVDLDHYLRVFDAIAVNRHFSDRTDNLDGIATSSLFARGDLTLRGFFWGQDDIDYSYLLLSADAPARIAGFVRANNRMVRFDQAPLGGATLLVALCNADENSVGPMADYWHFIMLPSRGATAPPGRIVSMLFRSTPPPLPSVCTERLRVRGDLTPVDTRALLAELQQTDRLVHFYQELDSFGGPERLFHAKRAYGSPPDNAIDVEGAFNLGRAKQSAAGASLTPGSEPSVLIPPGMGYFGLSLEVSAPRPAEGPCWVDVRVEVRRGVVQLASFSRGDREVLTQTSVMGPGVHEAFLKVPTCSRFDELITRNADAEKPAAVKIERVRLLVPPPR